MSARLLNKLMEGKNMKYKLINLSQAQINELKVQNTYTSFNTQTKMLYLSCCEEPYAQIDCKGYKLQEIEKLFGHLNFYSSKY
jgi:hypothetical protein